MQDYLPFTCRFCNKCFCLDHRLPRVHKCKNMPKEKVLTKDKLKIEKYKCDYKTCRSNSIFQFTCKTCEKTFCSNHRHHLDHEIKKS